VPILKTLRILEGELGDEGVRNLVKFLIETNNSSIKIMEFLNCNINPLGCEFISRIFGAFFALFFRNSNFRL